MAFPVVSTSNSGSVTTAATTHPISLPPTLASGNMIVVVFGIDGAPTITGWPTGWTQVVLASNSTSVTIEIRYKISDGTETSFSLSSGATSLESAHHSFQLAGAHATTPPEAATFTNTAATPNPPLLDPAGWGTEDTLWFACSLNDVGGTTTSAYPTSYTDGLNTATGGAPGIGLSTARRQLNAASENPGTFTISASQPYVTATLGVRPSSATGNVTHYRVGAVTTSGFDTTAKFSSVTSVRMAVSTASDLSSPTYSSAVTVDAQGMATLSISGRAANTQYYYGFETDSVLNPGGRGQCKTMQSGSHSFDFAVASCASSSSNATVFSTIRNRNPALFIMHGDMHYDDIDSTTLSLYRTAYDTALAQANQQTLYGNIPTAYVYDDHDFCGNNSDSTNTGATSPPQVYRQYFPHYTLEQSTTTEGVYHTFEVGRVRFIMLDLRRYRSSEAATDNSSKTMLGSTQKQWLKDLLSANKRQLKFLVSSVAWLTSDTAHDNWGSYQTERTELANYITSNNIANTIVLAGDMHAVASDDGRNSPAQLPVFHAAPLDRPSVLTGLGPFQYGPSPSSDGTNVTQYGWVTVTDTGTSSIAVTYNGYDQANTALLTTQNLSFEISPVQSVGMVPIA